VGTTTTNFMDDWFYGLSCEITPRMDFIAGRISSKVSRVKPGYLNAGSDGSVPTYKERDSDWFFGITMDTGVFSSIFK
jgi:hypothetical protein